jgi:hypothetical protein
MLRALDAPFHPQTQGKIRALASDTEKPGAAGEVLPTRRPRTPDRGVHRALTTGARSTRPCMADHGREMRCISFTRTTGASLVVRGLSVRLSAVSLRRDPHGSVKQIHHEELEDGDKERPSAFSKIMLKQTDPGIQ